MMVNADYEVIYRERTPEDYGDPDELETYGTIDIALNTLIVVDGKYIYIPDEEPANYLDEFRDKFKDTRLETEHFGYISYSEDYIYDDIISMVTPYLPHKNGLYRLTGFVTLEYDVTNILDWGNPKYDDNHDYDTHDCKIKLNKDLSTVSHMKCKLVSTDIPEGY